MKKILKLIGIIFLSLAGIYIIAFVILFVYTGGVKVFQNDCRYDGPGNQGACYFGIKIRIHSLAPYMPTVPYESK